MPKTLDLKRIVQDRTPESVLAPKSKIIMPTGHMDATKPFNYKELKEELKATGKLRSERFSNGKELGRFIDFHNQSVDEEKRRKGEDDVHEISKFLAKVLTSKTILLSRHDK